ARGTLGDRVREEIEREEPPGEPQPAPPAQAGSAPSGPAAPQPPREPAPPREPQPPGARAAPPPRRPVADAVHSRRIWALIGLGVLIVAVAALGTIISRGGGEDAPAPAVPKRKKTMEVVVPEGYDRTQIADVAKKNGLKGDYLEATESFKGFDLAKYGAEDAENLEGFLFPATYELFKGASVDDLVAKQLEAFEANATEVDLEGAEERGYTAYEVINVASMVEREIAVPEERKLAASVIYNRLDQGTPLGIDATIRFEDQNYSGQLVLSRLEEDTPYNTRTNAGLPPGPIGNPGLASLEAAVNPADTDFFYFVIKPGSCNEHTFVETEEEFAAASAEYQAALQAQGNSPTEC
ncbi:MAG: endolytic transglycosylase MltG, partial [Actinomycetota bacterium]|nr:endolytic transglycosylase MltG [Actinomycetota bacterium]